MANALESAYETAFGSRSSKGQLYSGFYLLLAGVALVVAGIVIYTVGAGRVQAAPADNTTAYNIIEVGIVLALLGAPSIFLGIFWALPSKVSMRILAGIGSGLALLGAILFSYWYPLNINVQDSQVGQEDHTGLVVFMYALGGVLLLVGTFTSLIGYYVSRVAVGGAAGSGRGAGVGEFSSPEYQYDIPDSVIEKDIELAMKRYKYAWGGEGGSGQSQTGIQINVSDEFEKGVVVGGKGVARTVHLETPQVDEATKRLRGMRPSTGKSVSGAWAEDSTKALLEFRKKHEAQAEAKQSAAATTASKTGRRGFWARLLEFLGIRRREATPGKAK